MTLRCLVFQHIACEPPGAYEEVLRARDAIIERVELDEGEAVPDWRAFDAIIAMGGPMSVNDELELPWLREEKRAIAEADAGREPGGAGVPGRPAGGWPVARVAHAGGTCRPRVP